MTFMGRPGGLSGYGRRIARPLFVAMVLGVSSQALAASTPAAAVSATPADFAVIEGFRSAIFGMNEKAVQAAILADFQVSPKAIRKAKSPIERTHSLTVTVPDVLPEGGTAAVSYVLGYKSRELIQTGVSWSRATDPAIDADTLRANGEILRNHFLTAGFDPATVKSGVAVDSGVLLFQAADPSGHTVLLLLQGNLKNDAAGIRQLEPEALVLLYVSSLEAPDIFKVAKGNF